MIHLKERRKIYAARTQPLDVHNNRRQSIFREFFSSKIRTTRLSGPRSSERIRTQTSIQPSTHAHPPKACLNFLAPGTSFCKKSNRISSLSAWRHNQHKIFYCLHGFPRRFLWIILRLCLRITKWLEMTSRWRSGDDERRFNHYVNWMNFVHESSWSGQQCNLLNN